MENEKNIIVEELKQEQKSKSKKTKIEEDNTEKSVDILQKENKELKEKLNNLTEQFNLLLKQLSNVNLNQAPQVIVAKERKFRIINLTADHNHLTLKVGGQTFTMNGYGTSKMFTEELFKDIFSKYRKLFFVGAITTDNDGLDFLEEIGYIDKESVGDIIASVWLSKSKLEQLGSLNVKQLEELYKQLHPSQQDRLVDAFLEGYDTDGAGYKELDKVILLNRLYTKRNIYKDRLKKAVLSLSGSDTEESE